MWFKLLLSSAGVEAARERRRRRADEVDDESVAFASPAPSRGGEPSLASSGAAGLDGDAPTSAELSAANELERIEGGGGGGKKTEKRKSAGRKQNECLLDVDLINKRKLETSFTATSTSPQPRVPRSCL